MKTPIDVPNKITYIDIEGKPRTITFVSNVNGLVQWHKLLQPSTACRWRLEDDGSTIQIPNSVWSDWDDNIWTCPDILGVE